MKTAKEILLEAKNARDLPLTTYISEDGFVWKMIEKAMEEYSIIRYKKGFEDGYENGHNDATSDAIAEIRKNYQPNR